MESCTGLYSKMAPKKFTQEKFETDLLNGKIKKDSFLELKIKNTDSEKPIFLNGYFVCLQKKDIQISDYPGTEFMTGLMQFSTNSIESYEIKK